MHQQIIDNTSDLLRDIAADLAEQLASTDLDVKVVIQLSVHIGASPNI